MFARYVGGVVLMACALSSQATTISFTGAPEGGVFTNPTNSGNGPSQYTSQGYKFYATGVDGHFHQNVYGPDSLLMHTNYGNTTQNTWILSQVTNSLFDLTSFTMNEGSLSWITNLGTTGTTSAGLNNVNLHGISSITFSLLSGNGDGSMDQFVVQASAIPEPASAALLLAGLGVMGAVARRRKQSAAA
jgi:hypothetical protein